MSELKQPFVIQILVCFAALAFVGMFLSILIVVYGIAVGLMNLIRPVIMWRAISNASVLGCVSAWYFYFKPNVAAYFRELRHGHAL